MTDTPTIGPAIVELLGHRRVAARVTETTIAGAGFLRLDEPDGRTQYVSPGSVYAIHPVSEDVLAEVATAWRTAPIARWELPSSHSDDEPAGSDDDGPF